MVLIAVGAFGQKLVDKVPFHWRHFYLGLDLTTAALAASLVNILDLIREHELSSTKMTLTVLFIAGSIVLFLALLGIHQEWEDESRYCLRQIFWLGFASNAVGGGLLFAFVILKAKALL